MILKKNSRKKKVSFPDYEGDVENIKTGYEQKGSLDIDEGLSHSIVEGNKQVIEQGMLLDAALNQGLMAFNPEMMFEQLVQDYSNSERIYGESMLRLATGYDTNSLKRNIKIPEFQRQLKNQMKQKELELKDENFLEDDGNISEKGFQLASLTMYTQELNELQAKGLGDKKTKKSNLYGDKENIRNYRKHDRYRDISIKSTIKKTLRKGHINIEESDLQVFERNSKGKIYIVYALDASGSMKGKKIEICKKAGIALAYKAIEEMDRVGLLVFGSDVQDVIYPTNDFGQFLKTIVKVTPKKQTDIAKTIERAIDMFPRDNVTKHLVLITDAVPTAGDNPFKDTLNLVERAAALGITISVVGIDLTDEGAELSRKIVEICNGRLYVIRDLENLDNIILEDYYTL